jgi:hypothetical protein
MWAFNSPPNYGVNTNPTQGELFVNDKIDRSDALVRETIQNSLDAKRPENQCVEVSFTLLEDSKLDWELVAPYVAALQPHLDACGIENDLAEFTKPSVLVVEDFGTAGLQGKTDEDDGEDFSLFWRNIGESHKEGNRGGRWGLGKTVFPNSSKISTYFGFTVRAGDGRQLLMGQVALKKHKLNEKTYLPHALFCASKPEEFEKPIEDASAIANFRAAFGVRRTDQPGLSVAVVYPHASITEESLLKAAVLHYFFPILQGKLVVKINEKELNASTLKDIAAHISPPDLRAMGEAIGFAEDICLLKQEAIPAVDNLEALKFPGGSISADAFSPASLKSLRETYRRGDLIALKLPIVIRPKHQTERQTNLKLFIKHLPALQKGHDFYLRGGISVIDHRCFGESDKAIGMLLADDEPVSRFLGDAENPAHTGWNAKSRGLETKYHDPQKTVMFIRRALRQLFDVLAKEEGVEDPNALLDVFFNQRDGDQPGGAGPGAGTIIPPPPPPPPLPPKPQKIKLDQTAGGFVVRPGKDLKPEDLPFSVTVDAAYVVRRGNAFRRYHRSDFEFEKEPIKIHTDPERVVDIAGTGNRLAFKIADADFELEAVGFDKNRDLKLRLNLSLEETTNDQDV